MVDGINSYRAIDNMTNGSNGGGNFSVKNGTSKQSIFLEKKPNYEIDGGTLPEVVVYGKKPEKSDVAKQDEPVNGGALPEDCDNGQKPEKDVATIDGGTLPEVVVTAQKPEVAAAAKPKRGFFAWLGRTLGLSKA